MSEAVTIQKADPNDASLLTQLARVSKAYWGYDAAFLAACAAELIITSDDIAHFPTFVLRVGEQIAGFYMLVPGEDGVVELDALFLDPSHIGHGFGRRLFEHAKRMASIVGYHTMKIQADPHATSFYERMGASVIGTSPSGSIPGRVLPVLHISVRNDQTNVIPIIG